jgi:hypothetical protein
MIFSKMSRTYGDLRYIVSAKETAHGAVVEI